METLEDLIETLLNTRDLCGNEAQAMRDWEADNDIKLQPAEQEIARSAVNSRWNYWRKAAGVKGAR